MLLARGTTPRRLLFAGRGWRPLRFQREGIRYLTELRSSEKRGETLTWEEFQDRIGQVLEREVIYQRVWGYAMAHGDRSVDVFVRKLRQKLERASPQWRYIHTHFGIGYRFAADVTRGPA